MKSQSKEAPGFSRGEHVTGEKTLTPRLVRMWAYTAAAMPVKIIAYEMGVTIGAAKNLRRLLFAECGFKNAVDAALAWHGCDPAEALEAARGTAE